MDGLPSNAPVPLGFVSGSPPMPLSIKPMYYVRMAGDQHHELRLPCGLAAKDGHTRDTALLKHILVG